MSDKTVKQDGVRDEQTLARLLRLAGPSEPVSSAIEDRVYAAVRQEWEASTTRPGGERVYRSVRREWNKTRARARPRLRRMGFGFAMAASILLAVAIFYQPEPAAPVHLPLGTIVKTLGSVPGSLASGQTIHANDEIATGSDAGLSILLANGTSLRVDSDTRLELLTPSEMHLLAGRVYADTGDHIYRANGLRIIADEAMVTDVGTQFSVFFTDGALDVAVREGRVDVATDGQELIAVAGERMLVEQDGTVQTQQLEAHDTYWDWATGLAPAYELDNRSLLDFLRWAARETGRELVFEDNELRMAAMRTDLHGSIDDVTPSDAIAAVLATTTFRYRIDEDRIVILSR